MPHSRICNLLWNRLPRILCILHIWNMQFVAKANERDTAVKVVVWSQEQIRRTHKHNIEVAQKQEKMIKNYFHQKYVLSNRCTKAPTALTNDSSVYVLVWKKQNRLAVKSNVDTHIQRKYFCMYVLIALIELCVSNRWLYIFFIFTVRLYAMREWCWLRGGSKVLYCGSSRNKVIETVQK